MRYGRSGSVRQARHRLWGFWVVVLASLALGAGAGCWSASQLDAASTGRVTVFDSGTPNFDMEALSTVKQGRTGVDLYLAIPHSSLSYERRLTGYVAVYELLIRFYDPKGKLLFEEFTEEGTREVNDEAVTVSYTSFLLEKRMDVRVGSYMVEVILKDVATELRTRRRQHLVIADPGLTQVQLSAIRLEGRRGNLPFQPMPMLFVPGSMDSVRAVVETYSRNGVEDVRVTASLIRFPSDTTVAEAPYWQVSPGALSQRGVRFDRGDTVQVTYQQAPSFEEAHVFRFEVPTLSEGIYRIEATVHIPDAGDGEEVLIGRQVRDVSVRSPSFPKISTLDEMTAALVYLAHRSEFRELQESVSLQEKRARFDAFWGSLVPDRNKAARLLEHYYNRVEEANRLFSTYKEGWKTDRGMIYIMLGPPLFVENRIGAEVWYYSYNESDPFNAFIFEHTNLYGSEGAFETFLLQRHPYYDRAWQRALDRWRRGRVLQD